DHAQDFVRTVEQLADNRIFVIGRIRQRSRVARADAKIRRVARAARRADPWIDGRLAILRTARGSDDAFQSFAMLALRLRPGYGQARHLPRTTISPELARARQSSPELARARQSSPGLACSRQTGVEAR